MYMKRGKKYARELLWEEFTGNKKYLLLYELHWCGIISKKEMKEALRLGQGNDIYHFMVSCFFLLYLKESF